MKRQVDRERELLPAIRQALSPTASDQQRVGARLAARLAAGATVDFEPAPRPAADAKLSAGWHGLSGIGQQAIAASLIGALAFGAGYLTGRSRPPETPTPTPTISPPSAPMASAAVIAPVAEPATEILPPHAAAKRTVEPAPAADTSAQTLSEEARELQRVDRALRAGMPLLALGILRELDVKFPKGVFMEERTAASFIARCQNGEAGSATSAAAWLAKHPRSVYAARLQASCGLEAAADEKTP